MTAVPAPMPRARSGIPGFDVVAGGGLPEGRATLVSGTAGSGKTVFGMQFLAAGAAAGEPGLIVTFEEAPANLLANAASFGWGIAELVESGRLVVLDATPDPDEIEAGAFDFLALLARIEHAVARTGARRILFDAIDAVLGRFADPDVVRRELGRIVDTLRRPGLTTIITAERATEDGSIARHDVEQFVVDGIVVLRNARRGYTRRRTVELLKQRGYSHNKGEYPFVIDPDAGIEIIPVSEIETERPAASERISLGDPDLDAMCGAGVFRDSLLLVSGATGTGKSMLAEQFVIAGLAAGERAIIFSFEESVGQIVRNAATWGFDLETPRRDGALRIVAHFADRMGVEDLLLMLKREVADHGAQRVVIDSVTALAHGADARGLRDLTVGLSAFTKARGVALMLITTPTEIMGGPVATGADLSTLTDGILLLRHVEMSGDLRRAVLVLKMRGVAHDRALHEFEMGEGGMHVIGPLRGVGSVLGGSAVRELDPPAPGV